MADIFSTTFDDTNFPTVRATGRHWDQTIDGIGDNVVGQTGDGIEGFSGWTTSNGAGDQILTAANYSSGVGGKGYRHWIGNGVNVGGGSLFISFPARSEIWMRYYVRYQSGFAWSGTDVYNKQIYWGSPSAGPNFYGPLGFGSLYWTLPVDGTGARFNENFTWVDWNGGSTGDGLFHCVELHLKMNTASNHNGILEMKLDGTLLISSSNVRFTTSGETFSEFRLGENHRTPDSGSSADQYQDFDDIVISDSGWVGQIGADTTAPTLSAADDGTPTSNGATGASVSTDEGNGTLYWVVVTNGGSCTAAQLKAGTGGNIVAGVAGNQVVTATGTQTVTSIVGLSASTLYQIKYLHRDAAGNDSSQASVNLTTTAGADTTAPTLSSASAGTPTSHGCTGASVSTDEGNGTLYWAIVTGGGSCTDAQLKAGTGGNIVVGKSGTQAVVATGTQFPVSSITGLNSSTNYHIKYLHRDAAGNDSAQATANFATTTASAQTIFFSEGFEDSSLAARGWFDGTEGAIDTVVFSPNGGAGSIKYHWQLGNTNSDPQTGSRRHLISDTGSETLYVEFDIKVGTAGTPWQGSGDIVHPHIMYLMSSADNEQGALANNVLQCYVEASDVSGGNSFPYFGIQDNLRIDTGNLGVDLLGTAANHSVAGWNGQQTQATPSLVDAYGGGANNYTYWYGPSRAVLNNTWHTIGIYLQMNSVVATIPQANGIFRYWVDGALQMSRNNVYFRTNQHPALTFKTLVLGPYIGVGSPIAQDMWIDNLVVANQPEDAGIRYGSQFGGLG